MFSTKYTVKHYIDLLKLMILSREKDKREAMLIRQGKGYGHVSSSGHEALMAISFLLSKNDYLFTYYRGSHLALGKGANLPELAKDFFAKKSSSSGGRSASAHFGCVSKRIFPEAAPIASHCLPAVGVAWGQSIDNKHNITLCSVGDGATRSGEFYEAICHSIQNKLPIIFLIEDNHYAISTNTKFMMPFRMNIFDTRLFSHVDGSNAFNMLNIAKIAIQTIKEKKNPIILWCDVDRLDSHTTSDDHTLYRPSEEICALRDPIKIYRDKLIKLGYIDDTKFQKFCDEAQAYVKSTYKKMYELENPDSSNIATHIYSESHNKEIINHKLMTSYKDIELNMVEGVNLSLNLALDSSSKVIVFGQDIEDPKGGVFGFTKGLSKKYPGRIINAPIAEATIVGSGIGLSICGYKPIFEIQFIDFITPAFNQITCNLSSLRWRSCGQWSCPLIIYAPYGAYLPSGGIWHSQSNDRWWTSIIGLKVAVPSTAEDLIGIFLSAVNADDPSLILIPKHIFRIKQKISNIKYIKFGKGKIIQSGVDVTIVCWGNAVELAQNASKILSKKNISVEIIDLITLVPCDFDLIFSSLSKTRRLVIVQEDSKTSSFGASIISEVLSQKNYFDSLYSQPILISKEDIHIPYHNTLEYTVLPSASIIADKIINLIT